MMTNWIDVAETVGTRSLVGRPLGEQHLPKLLQTVLPLQPGAIVIWDCENVDVLSASYVASTFLALIRMVAADTLDRHFVLANVPTPGLDDVRLALEHGGVPALLLNEQNKELKVIGPLDPANEQALRLVEDRQEVSARELADADPSVGQTGWINRLNTLATWGLVHRTKRGREFVFQPISTELSNG